MLCTCKTCSRSFRAKRAGALYCSGACRTAAHRKRQAPLPRPYWFGDVPRFRAERQELANHLLWIAEHEDDGAPKTGRRFWYLALSHGFISVDMGASDVAKAERQKAQKKITDILGTLRKSGELKWDKVLDLTRDLDEWQTYTSPRKARAAVRRLYDEDRW